MLRSILRVAVVSSVMLGASSALAADAAPTAMGSAGTIFLGAERLFGVSFNNAKSTTSQGGTDVTSTYSRTDIGLLLNANGASAFGEGTYLNPFLIPRLGFDYSVIDNLTVGGSIGFWHASSSTKAEGGGRSQETDGDSVNAFLFAPRVGYIIGLNEKMGIWLRGGLTYYNFGVTHPKTQARNVETSDSVNGLAFSLDPVFVLSPVEHFGLFGGLMADIPLSGSTTNDNGNGTKTSTDLKFQNIGLNFGILGYF
jgi:hypothetical protein